MVIPSRRDSLFTACILTSNRKYQTANIEELGLKKCIPIFLRMAYLECILSCKNWIAYFPLNFQGGKKSSISGAFVGDTYVSTVTWRGVKPQPKNSITQSLHVDAQQGEAVVMKHWEIPKKNHLCNRCNITGDSSSQILVIIYWKLPEIKYQKI